MSYTSSQKQEKTMPPLKQVVVGHVNLFSSSSDLPHKALASMADKHGPIFTVRFGVHKLLVVNSCEIAKELFTTHDAVVSSRPKYAAAKILGYDYIMFGVASYSPFWRQMRKITSMELLSSRRLDQLKHVRVSEVQNAIKNMHELWREKKNVHGKALVDMKKWFGELDMSVMLRLVVGKRYGGAVNHDEQEEMNKCRKVMREFFQLMTSFVVGDTVPLLGWLDLGGYEKDMKRVAGEIDCLVGKWLDEHRRKKISGEDSEEKDFMDVMISAVETGDLADYDADAVIKSTCLDVIASSADTITIALIWALSLLLNNPHALQKAQEELDMHVGNDRQVNDSDITKLVYLQAIIKETLRLYPGAPLGGIKMVSQDCTIAGYHVPKDTWLVVNIWKLQRDPKVWSNPTKFIPESFLVGTQMGIDVKGTNFELIPFGAGRRYCPGIGLALQMLHIILASLLQNFDVSTPVDTSIDMTESAGLTNPKASPLEVLIAPRMAYIV